MSILESLVQNEEAVYNNSDVNLVISTLKRIQEGCHSFDGELDYTPEMVPIIKLESYGKDGEDIYCVKSEDFKHLLGSQNMEIGDAMAALIDEVDKDPENHIQSACEMAIIVNEEDVSSLYDIVTEDPTKINARCEAVARHVDYLQEILETGCNVYLS